MKKIGCIAAALILTGPVLADTGNVCYSEHGVDINRVAGIGCTALQIPHLDFDVVLHDDGNNFTVDPVSIFISLRDPTQDEIDDGAMTGLFIGTICTNQPIRDIVLSNSSGTLRPAAFALSIAVSGTFGPNDGVPSIERILLGSSQSLVSLRSVRVDGDLGSLTTNRLINLEVGGDVTGDIVLAETDSGTVTGAWLSESSTIGGDLLGDIVCENGFLSGLVEVEGRIGTALQPVLIDTFSGIFTGSLTAGEINATVWANQIIGTLKTTTANGRSGDFNGTLNVIDELDANARIEIGGSLSSGSEIAIWQPDGVKGAVIFNHELSGGSWDGVVTMNADPSDAFPSYTLSSAGYSQTAADIGGGSVGVAAFSTHGTDSAPLFQGTPLTFSATAQPANFDIRHYGPIEISGSGESVRLIRRVPCGVAATEDVTDEWAFSYSALGTVLSMDSSQDANFRNGFEYLMVVENNPVNAGAVLCDLDPGVSQGVESYPSAAWFTVGTGCHLDMDSSGLVDLPDLNAVLSAFDTTGVNMYADTDLNGAVDLADLNAVLGSFGEDCCSMAMMMARSAGGASAGDTIAQSLGFNDVDDLCATVAILPEEGRAIVFDALREEAAGW